ncbi:DnaJ domain-containing protein/TPR_11 domain-containing protein [Cephalotus follicularis]|uniref:DnaJ domain-containing protein/TPR_11 domain-containing protein n=1 Tax=Cephalotus follicularis TaxID=3775 RepID=A0A1Q3AXZ3_CEPFO|nr:DnaJ domain-containing protein/TPR_11 domain-containing protein [Cephalotus follicularis]
MSPVAAVEFQSSSVKQPYSIPPFQIPHPNFTSFTPNNRQNINSSSNFNNNNNGDTNGFVQNGVAIGSQSGSAAVSGRVRPRLVKVRKWRSSSRSSAVPASEMGSRFNPFKSSSGNPVQVNNDISSSVLNGDVGFVFGADKSEIQDKQNSGMKVEDMEANFDNNMCGFVFGANLRDVEKSETIELAANSGDSNPGFVFDCNGNNLGLKLNLEKGESTKSEVNTVIGDSVSGSVLGASWSNSGLDLNLNLENKQKFNENGRWKQDYGQGVFVFGSGSKKSSSSSKCAAARCTDEVKLKSENLGDNNHIAKNQNSCLGFDVSDKYEVGTDMFNSIGTTPVFELPDGMKNLNINDFGNVDVTNTTKFSNENLGATFVLRSIKKSPVSSDGSSAIISHDQIPEGQAAGIERDKWYIYTTIDKNHTLFGNSCNIANDVVRSSSSEPFVFRSSKNSSGSSDDCSATTCHEQIPEGQAAGVGRVKRDSEVDQFSYNARLNGVTTPTSFSSVGLFSNLNVFGKPFVVGVEQKDVNSSAMPRGLGVSFVNFVSPNRDSSSFKANLLPESNRKLKFTVKIKDKKSKKIRGKMKQPSLHNLWLGQDHVPKQSNFEENPDCPGCCSPMDFSPYEESTEFSGETSAASIGFSLLYINRVPSALHKTATTEPKNEDSAAEGEYDINRSNRNDCKPNLYNNCCEHERCDGDCRSTGSVSEAENACPSFKFEHVFSRSVSGVALSEDGDGSIGEKLESNCRTPFCFGIGLESEKKFTFSAASTAQGSFSLTKGQQRRKNRTKVGNDTFSISPSSNVKVGPSSVQSAACASTSSLFNVAQDQGDKSTFQSERGNRSKAGEQVKKGSVSSADTFQAACEMWRLRGNQAYKDGNLSNAEDYYTQGINSFPSTDTSGSRVKPLVLCYSNRAATQISLGKIREALGDCMMAATLDPDFLKVYVRAANCHLVLGEVENAMLCFNKCLESGAGVCLDRRVTIEAADGVQKAQKVAECINRSADLLEQKTSDAAGIALEIIAEALSISSGSEKLLEMKAEALCVLLKYEEAIQLCEQTLPFAEMNFASASTNRQLSTENHSLAKLWRWHCMSRSYFCMGRIEVALDFLQKLEQVGSTQDKYAKEILESSKLLANTIRELLHRKNAGNEAVQLGRYTEAVEHYTVAISSNVESRPFAAICFCNRAAAHQALGQITDAIADCSLAMALDENYRKAVSRRAALHEMIRDYGQAASDLQRLISILENHSVEKGKPPETPGRSTSSKKELRQAQGHLSSMQEEAKKGIPLNFYLILGIKLSDKTSEIKKAYRKAALRHHPDKAGQFLARSESGDEGRLWKQISQEVKRDADRLFKLVAEAYAVLSETTKRTEYDLEEELRKAPKESNGRNPHRRPSDAHGSPFERSASRRSWQENWRT